MIVSWNWLKDYVSLDLSPGELTERLTMAGLNLESIAQVEDDWAIDLEVTSNRPDCLGHVGIAREAAVLCGMPLTVPQAQPKAVSTKVEGVTSVANECPDLCPQYIARVIRGVKVGPSPAWLRKRLETIGLTSINNVVDATNYVLMECGQPLHAFDLDKLREKRIVVRRALAGEKLVAIDHNEYSLSPEMCVIADAEHPVAIGGVMGGAATEIGAGTTNLLIEAADFKPLSIRNTSRALGLRSDSSYRFERGVDPAGVDWASRRCCELILQIAGGELLAGAAVAGAGRPVERPPIVLRFGQIARILGIDVPPECACEILRSLGLKQVENEKSQARFVAPSWRRDLEREADLIEEVARIHGYDKIPDDVAVPLELSSRTRRDRVVDEICGHLTACGFYEAVTFSLVRDEMARRFQWQGEREPVRIDHPSWRMENALRQSLIPSLLVSRRENERHGSYKSQLFEIAKVYLEAAPAKPEREVEPTRLGLVSGRPFSEVKGILEALVRRLNRKCELTVAPSAAGEFVEGRGAELFLNGRRAGILGEVARAVIDRFDLRESVTAAELDLALLEDIADLNPQFVELPQYPAVERDLNFVLDEPVTWDALATAAREAAGPLLEEISFGGQYRGQQIGAGKKSYLVRLRYRAAERTLTSDEVDAAQKAVVTACTQKLKAELRA